MANEEKKQEWRKASDGRLGNYVLSRGSQVIGYLREAPHLGAAALEVYAAHCKDSHAAVHTFEAAEAHVLKWRAHVGLP